MSIYIQVNQKTAGPFEEHAVIAWLQGGRLSPEVLACRQEGSEWQPLRTVLTNPARPPDISPMLDSQSIADRARQNRVCEKCDQHEGDVYSFSYGRKISHTITRVGMNTNVHTTKYNVAGEKYAAACDNCIRRRRITRLVVFGLMFAVGAGIALWTTTWDNFHGPLDVRQMSQLQTVTGASAAIVGLIGLWRLLPNLFSSKITHAENLIIGLKKRELRKLGFDTFWNTKSYFKLSRR
jgi:hypothetical protein